VVGVCKNGEGWKGKGNKREEKDNRGKGGGMTIMREKKDWRHRASNEREKKRMKLGR
jgi:hypothetical protein